MSTLRKRRTSPAGPVAVMIRITVACVVALGLIVEGRSQANAQAVTPQVVCGSHAEISSKLADHFAEAAVGIGLANDGNVIEVLTSDDGNTWSILMTRPDGKSCLVAAGRVWEQITPDPAQKGPQA